MATEKIFQVCKRGFANEFEFKVMTEEQASELRDSEHNKGNYNIVIKEMSMARINKDFKDYFINLYNNKNCGYDRIEGSPYFTKANVIFIIKS